MYNYKPILTKLSFTYLTFFKLLYFKSDAWGISNPYTFEIPCLSLIHKIFRLP